MVNGELKKQNEYFDQLLRAPKTTSILHLGSPEELEITGYTRSKWKTFLTWIGIVLSLGILRLVLHWWRHWLLVATHSPTDLENAKKLLIRQNFQGNHTIFYVKTVTTLDWMHFKNDPTVNEQDFHISAHFSGGVFRKTKSIRMFTCKQLRYVWNDETGEFQPLKGLDTSVSNVYLHKTTGLTRSEEFARRATYGLNEITIPYKSAFVLLATEALNPFYVFQIFSVILWFLYDYYYYASVIIGMSVFGIFMSIRQTKKNQDALMKTVYSNDHAIVLHENGETELTETRYLVPGDIIEIPIHGCTMQCDAVLLSGNCIVDEALLTGESVPVTKTLLPLKRGVQFDMKEHGRHVLFSGTKVLQTRYIGSEKVLARVISTGDTTAKGNLIRSILYPPPVDYKFEQDSYKFIALLAAIAGIGFTYSLTQKILNKIDPIKLAVESLDLITIVVPPALPAAMTVGRFYAQKRLEKGKIFCISPRSINVAGSIDLVCFDKTGTLTEDGLDMWGVVIRESFEHPIKDLSSLPRDHFLFAMACCHSITVINGERRGDPLDLKMFEATEWELEDVGVPDEKMFDVLYPVIVKPKDTKEKVPLSSTTLSSSLDDLISSLPDNPSIGIVREFPFASSLQRMSVITRSLSASHFTVYAKGSPEIIHALSHPETLPRDFYEKLDVYARKGLRVIALAYKPLDKKLTYAKVQKVPRDQIECDLSFLGFVVLENRLKPETSEIIRELTAANIRSVMVTGDNILTAVSVARDCGILCRSENVITVTTRKKEILYTATPSDQLGSFSSLDTCLTTTESWKGVESGLDTTIGPKYKFAVEGKTWEVIRNIHPDVLPKIVSRGAVFARMSPDQKQELIVELQALGHYVAMCGDGANDCGALKAAHAGISLSQAESSVASPFTSHEPTIGCVPKVIKEGRCALVTSFGIFKFMAAYSLVQFVSVMILYSINSNLTDIQFLFIDLGLISVTAFFFGRTSSAPSLVAKTPPPNSLIAAGPVVSLTFHLIIIVAVQVVSWVHLHSETWFEAFKVDDLSGGEYVIPCYENYTIFVVSSFQYLILAFVFSEGRPHRKQMFSNLPLVICLGLNVALVLYVTAGPTPEFSKFVGLKTPPSKAFCGWLVGYGVANFLVAVFAECLVFPWIFNGRKGPDREYERVEKYLDSDSKWPPISMEATDLEGSFHLENEKETYKFVDC